MAFHYVYIFLMNCLPFVFIGRLKRVLFFQKLLYLCVLIWPSKREANTQSILMTGDKANIEHNTRSNHCF